MGEKKDQWISVPSTEDEEERSQTKYGLYPSNILELIESEFVFKTLLVNENKELQIRQTDDNYLDIMLSKSQVGMLIAELTEIHNKMKA